MLHETLQAWRLLHSSEEYQSVRLVFHTSCLNYKLSDLKALRQLNFDLILPNSVRQELELLSSSRLYGEAARFLLSSTQHKAWDLEEFYSTGSRSGITPHHRGQSGILIFLFGDLAKQDEFLRHISAASEWREHYIFYNSGWSCTKGDPMVLPVSQAKGLPMRRTHVLSSNVAMPPLNELKRLTLRNGRSSTRLDSATLKPTGQSGSFAQIYTSTACPNRLIKCYKRSAAVGTQLRKLEALHSLVPAIGHLPLALPRELLFSGDKLIGYTMTPCPGRPFSELIRTGWNGYDFGEVCQNLSRLLVELHTLHILVNDLSFNNILVDTDNQVYLVDCDSFQLVDYPGGGITYLYQHPEIQEAHFHDTLREPCHEYFAFAVLMFQCICRCENPLTQVLSDESEDKITWSNAQFPLEANCCDNVGHANQATYENWASLPAELQQAFADEFHFRRIHSIGAWLRIFSS